jgi:hypothetical protein
MTNLNGADDERFITLLPSDFTNEIFEQNMAYLNNQQPALFNAVKNHKCKEYWLCSNPDGSPNIVHMPSKTPVYAASSMDEIMAPIHKQIDELYCYIHVNKTFFGEGVSSWLQNSPIQIKMLDSLYKAGIFADMKLSSKMMTPLHNYCTNYLPLVRVYGIGLGYHLTELIKRKKISYMTIYEPNFDLFYISLYTIPWDLIFKYFEFNNKGINLVLDCSPDVALESNMAFIEKRLTPLTSLFYRFNHFNRLPVMKEIVEKEPRFDNTHRANVDAGWYEDQRAGFYFSAKNIQKDNKVFSGKKAKRYFRAFIVGSGPSLNESIGYIKAHQVDALILACGSALTPLLESGIVPDYQIIQERTWHVPEHEKRHDLDLLKEISLLKLNVISPKIDRHYKETLVFQKFRDPGSALLSDYPVTTEVNPTVTNAGVTFAAELGAKEVYLFGVDYGAPKGSEKMHASNTLWDDKDRDDSVKSENAIDLAGNLGGVICSTPVLSWSHEVTELSISRHPNINWINVGEGALIAGATAMAVEELPEKFKKKIKKDHLRSDISCCFNNDYSSARVLEKLNTYHMKQVEEYFQAILDFTASTPQSREEIISTLSLMYKAASVGANQEDFLPASLVSAGIKQFITVTYTQTGLYRDDDSAVRFFEAAKVIFTEHINDIREDLHKILGYLASDEDVEIINKW